MPHGSAVETTTRSPIRSVIAHARSTVSGYEAVGVSLASRAKMGPLSGETPELPVGVLELDLDEAGDRLVRRRSDCLRADERSLRHVCEATAPRLGRAFAKTP